MLATTLMIILPTVGVIAADTGLNPKDVVAVIDDMGSVGYRISDAQALAEIASIALRKRVGNEAVVYEGYLVSSETLKKMLGSAGESQITDDKIAYYKAAIANAKHRVRIRFGKKKKLHWVTLTCRAIDAAPADVIEKRELTGPDFGVVRKATEEAMTTFCAPIKGSEKTPPQVSGSTASGHRPLPPSPKKKKREWIVPPRRD